MLSGGFLWGGREIGRKEVLEIHNRKTSFTLEIHKSLHTDTILSVKLEEEVDLMSIFPVKEMLSLSSHKQNGDLTKSTENQQTQHFGNE